VLSLLGGRAGPHPRARFHPFENLTAHYLLLSQRIP
jgi:hypothetical protein